MTLRDRISILEELGNRISSASKEVRNPLFAKAIIDNPWFTKEGIENALSSITSRFLQRVALEEWTDSYNFTKGFKTVGLVLAGNIPMVGFHDILSVFMAGHKAMIKYSHKDKVLLQWIIQMMIDIDDQCEEYFLEVERLKGMDAVIATGGDTAATHFAYYFSKYPNIIRKNRSSVAVIEETDNKDTLRGLGKDVFTYYGLGCRNVSKIYLPQGFQTDEIFEALVDYGDVIHHNKYKNNYDYSYALYLLAKQPFLTNNFLIVREDEAFSSRIACLHYSWYADLSDLVGQLHDQLDNIQCVASSNDIAGLQTVRIGACQSPGLSDYADHVDTLAFLTQLND